VCKVKNVAMFKEKDIICFLGDSITANGLWMAEVYQYLRKKYKIKCYNCGVSGSTAQNALHYLYDQCLIYNPDFVVMMFGINDIKRELYTEENLGNAEILKRKREALENHKTAYEKLVQAALEFGTKIILCTPVPYDDVNEKTEYKLKCRDALEEITIFVKALAEKYHCNLVDLNKQMQSMLGERNIISEDRVHPTDEGYHIMAQLFLHEIKETDQCNFDIPFLWEEWNRDRFRAEQELILVNFIKYCVLLETHYVEKKSIEECKQTAMQRYKQYEDKTTVFPQAYKAYMEKIDTYDLYIGEIVKKTIF